MIDIPRVNHRSKLVAVLTVLHRRDYDLSFYRALNQEYIQDFEKQQL